MTPPRLENRLPPEELLERDEHPLRELAWLAAAGLFALGLLVVLTGYAARWLAPKLPFEYEVALAEKILDGRELGAGPAVAHSSAAARRAALQAIADRVAGVMDLPPGMKVVVGDDPSGLVNAYATIGGRIRVFHGLLRRLDTEEALAALLAHEIAHVKHRHVAASVGHGLAVALLISTLSPEGGAQVARTLLNDAAQIALLGYSRQAEEQADVEALAASVALYGHAEGLIRVFAALPEGHSPSGATWLRSHPDTNDRVARVSAMAQAQGAKLAGSRTPLPVALRELPASGSPVR